MNRNGLVIKYISNMLNSSTVCAYNAQALYMCITKQCATNTPVPSVPKRKICLTGDQKVIEKDLKVTLR